MFKEIALDPQCMANFEYYGLLKNSFGPERGRYLIAPLREWVQAAVQALKASDIAPVKRKSVSNFLNKLQRDRQNPYLILPKDRQNVVENGFEPWLRWLSAQQQFRPFVAVVSEQQIDGSLDYLAVLDDKAHWPVSPTIQVDRNVESIASALMPLWYLAKDIVIIDAYFRFTVNPLLQQLLKDISRYRSIISLTIVTAMDTANAELVYQREFASKPYSLPAIRLMKVPQGYFHDRYLLTNIGSVKAGHGFSVDVEKGVQADKLSLSLCGEAETADVHQHVRSLLERQLVQEWQWPAVQK